MLEILITQQQQQNPDLPPPEDEIIETEELTVAQPASRVSNESFGICFSVTRNNETLAVMSLKNSGTLYILRKGTNGTYNATQEITLGGLGSLTTHEGDDRLMVSISHNGDYVAAANVINRKVKILKLNNIGDYEEEQEILTPSGLNITSVKFLENENKLVCAFNNRAGFVIYECNEQGTFLEEQNTLSTGSVRYISTDETGDTIITSNSKGNGGVSNPTISVYKKSINGSYDLVQTITRSSMPGSGYSTRIFATLALSGDGKTLVTGDYYIEKGFIFKLENSSFVLKQSINCPLSGAYAFGWGNGSSYSGKTIAISGSGYISSNSFLGASFIFKENEEGLYVNTNLVRSLQTAGADKFGHVVHMTQSGRNFFASGFRFEGKGGIFAFSI